MKDLGPEFIAIINDWGQGTKWWQTFWTREPYGVQNEGEICMQNVWELWWTVKKKTAIHELTAGRSHSKPLTFPTLQFVFVLMETKEIIVQSVSL